MASKWTKNKAADFKFLFSGKGKRKATVSKTTKQIPRITKKVDRTRKISTGRITRFLTASKKWTKAALPTNFKFKIPMASKWIKDKAADFKFLFSGKGKRKATVSKTTKQILESIRKMKNSISKWRMPSEFRSRSFYKVNVTKWSKYVSHFVGFNKSITHMLGGHYTGLISWEIFKPRLINITHTVKTVNGGFIGRIVRGRRSTKVTTVIEGGGQCYYTGKGCIETCFKKPPGRYQSCRACDEYIRCDKRGVATIKKTKPGKVWSGSHMVPLGKSDTCSECVCDKDNGWMPYKGSCYYVSKIRATWKEAETACENMEGNLVTINDKPEEEFVQSVVRTSGKARYWLGLLKVSGRWVWMNEKKVSYSRWKKGEPNGSGRCAKINRVGSWSDADCDKKYNFICKKGLRRPENNNGKVCRDIGSKLECLYAKSLGKWVNSQMRERCRKTFGYCYDLEDPNDADEKCKEGFRRRGNMCDSINECVERPKGFIPCGKGIECEDLPFGYRCKCKWWQMEYVENNEIKCSRKNTCYAAGDPHFGTLDKLRFNYQGTCEFLLFRVKDNSLVLNTQLGWRFPAHKTSFVRVATITIRDGRDTYKVIFNGIHNVVSLQKNKADAERVYSDRSFGNGYSLLFRGNNFDTYQLKTPRGILFEFSRGQNIRVRVARDAWKGKGMLDGMCGDYDGNKKNDAPKGIVELAKKYKIRGKAGCELAEDIHARKPFRDQCERFYGYSILQTALGECEKNIMASRQLIEDCAIDLQVGLTICQHFEPLFKEFAEKCDRKLDWRSAFNCPRECPEHSTYRAKMPLSFSTCSEKADPKDAGLFGDEGCMCDPGYLLSGTKCVLPEDCGCKPQRGPYIPSGVSTIRRMRNRFARVSCDKRVAVSVTVECQGPCKFVSGPKGLVCRALNDGEDNLCKIVETSDKPKPLPNEKDYDPKADDEINTDPDNRQACTDILTEKVCKAYRALGKCNFRKIMKKCEKTCEACVSTAEVGHCKAGYVWRKRACRDINECRVGVPAGVKAKPCGKGVTCRNTPGSFQCICKLGQMLVETDKEQICVDAMECRSTKKFTWKNFDGKWFWVKSDCDYVLVAGGRTRAFPDTPNILIKNTVQNMVSKSMTVTIGRDTVFISKSAKVNGVDVDSEMRFGKNNVIRRNEYSRWIRIFKGEVVTVWELKTPYFHLTWLDNGNIHIVASDEWVKSLRSGLCVDRRPPRRQWHTFIAAHFARKGCVPPPPIKPPRRKTIKETKKNITEIKCSASPIKLLKEDDLVFFATEKEANTDQCTIYEQAVVSIQKNAQCPGWRKKTSCLVCDPKTTVYTANMPDVVPSCANPHPKTVRDTHEEGCLCKSGRLDSNGRCVKASDCGCLLNTGDYIEKGAKKLIQSKGSTYEVTCVNYTLALAREVKTKCRFVKIDGEIRCVDNNKRPCAYVTIGMTFYWYLYEEYTTTITEIITTTTSITTTIIEEELEEEETVKHDDVVIVGGDTVEEKEDESRRGTEYCKDVDPLCIVNLEADINYCSDVENLKKCPKTCAVCKVADECGKNYRMDPNKNTCFDIDECAEMDNPLIMNCPKNSKCVNIPNGYRCVCPNGKAAYRKGNQLVCEEPTYATCAVYGYGHFYSFDEVNFDFSGQCTYTMIEPVDEDSDGLVVKASMKPTGRKNVPLVNTVEVSYDDLTFKLQDDKVYIMVTLKGSSSRWKELSLPRTINNKYSVRYLGSNKIISLKLLDAGVEFTYKSGSHLKIEADSRYAGLIGGLCGNYNGDSSDEKSKLVNDVLIEFQDYITTITGEASSGNNCNAKPRDPPNNPIYLLACEEIFRKSPVGTAYLEEKSMTAYNKLLRDCSLDIAIGISQCTILANAALQLEKMIDWRTETCALDIPPNSQYYPFLNVTVTTCEFPVKGIRKLGEGYLCNKGYFESAETCVKPEECGCFKDTYYRKSGEVWYQKSRKAVNIYYKYLCQGTTIKRTQVTCPSPCSWVARSRGTYACVNEDKECDVVTKGKTEPEDNDGGFKPPKEQEDIVPYPQDEPMVTCADKFKSCSPDQCSRRKMAVHCQRTCGFCYDKPRNKNCKKNFEEKDGVCYDINECLTGRNTCGEGSKCINEPGTYKCSCPKRKMTRKTSDGRTECSEIATCSVTRGTHIMTFDGNMFDNRAACSYVLMETKSHPLYSHILITTKLYRKAKAKALSLPQYFEIRMVTRQSNAEYTIHVENLVAKLVSHSNRILSDQEKFGPSGSFSLLKQNNRMSILMPDMLLEFRGFRTIFIRIARDVYGGQTSGLCGNADGKTKRGTPEAMLSRKSSWALYSSKYEYKDGVTCDSKQPPVELQPDCADACEAAFSETSPFKVLPTKVRKDFVNRCTLDLCVDDRDKCQILADLARDVYVTYGILIEWRDELGCSLNCAARGRVYRRLLPLRTPTCVDPAPFLEGDPIGDSDGCMCATGLLENNDNCIAPSQCGCEIDDKYYSAGTQFTALVPDDEGDKFYRILIKNNGMIATPVACEEENCVPDGERCVRKDNPKQYCNKGLKTLGKSESLPCQDGYNPYEADLYGTIEDDDDLTTEDLVSTETITMPVTTTPTPPTPIPTTPVPWTTGPTTAPPVTTREEVTFADTWEDLFGPTETKTMPVTTTTTTPIPTTVPWKPETSSSLPGDGLNTDSEGEKADIEYYKLTLKTDYYKIKPHDIIRGVVKRSGVTATTFLTKYPPFNAISSIKDGPGWSPDLSVKQRQCLTIDLGHVASVHGWMTMGARLSDGSYGYVKYYTVDVSVDGKTWSTRELRHKPGVARVYVGNDDAETPRFHCEHRYRGTPMSIRYFRLCLIEGQYSVIPQLRIIILGFREPRDPALMLGLVNDRYTLSLVGCPCYFDTSSTNCACCQPGASQCGPSSPSQCVLTGFPKMCGTVHPRLPADISFPGQKLDLPVEEIPKTHPFKSYITDICPAGYRICSLSPFICKSAGHIGCPAVRKQPKNLIATETDYILSGTPLSTILPELLDFGDGLGPGEDHPEGPEGDKNEPNESKCICE